MKTSSGTAIDLTHISQVELPAADRARGGSEERPSHRRLLKVPVPPPLPPIPPSLPLTFSIPEFDEDKIKPVLDPTQLRRLHLHKLTI